MTLVSAGGVPPQFEIDRLHMSTGTMLLVRIVTGWHGRYAHSGADREDQPAVTLPHPERWFPKAIAAARTKPIPQVISNFRWRARSM